MITIYSKPYARNIVNVLGHPQPDKYTLVDQDGTAFELNTNFSSASVNLPDKHPLMLKLKGEGGLRHIHYSTKTKTYYCAEETENGPEIFAVSFSASDSLIMGKRTTYTRKDIKIPSLLDMDVHLAEGSDAIIYFDDNTVYCEDGQIIYRQVSDMNRIVDVVSKESDLFILTRRELIRIRDGGIFAVDIMIDAKGSKLKVFNDLIGISSGKDIICYDRNTLKKLQFASNDELYMVLGEDCHFEEICSYALIRTSYDDTVHVVLSTPSGIYGTLVKYPGMFKRSVILLNEHEQIIIFDCMNGEKDKSPEIEQSVEDSDFMDMEFAEADYEPSDGSGEQNA